MARQILPTDFQDDVFLEEKRKYRMIQNEDGTVSFEDVTDYTQLGSNFGAANINNTNDAVNQSVDKAHIIDNLDDIMANQADDMVAGAKSVSELNSKLKTRNVIVEEKSQTFSVNKGAALTKNFSFDAKVGYTRNLIIYQISGTGSDSAVVNMHADGNVSVFAPNMNSNVTVNVRCLYTPD